MGLTKLLSVLGGVASLTFALPALAEDAKTPAPAVAPSAKALELTKRYMTAMHMERTMEQSMAVMMPLMLSPMERATSNLTSEQKATIRGIVEEALHDFTKQSVARMEVRMPPILARTFTEAELEEIVVFYESPSGQAALTKGPAMMAEVMPLIMEDASKLEAQMLIKLCAAYPAQCRGEAPNGKASPRAS